MKLNIDAIVADIYINGGTSINSNRKMK